MKADSDSNYMASKPEGGISNRSKMISVALLCFVNLINYMDRYTVSSNEIIISIRNLFFYILIEMQHERSKNI
jgi:hypothetical protein